MQVTVRHLYFTSDVLQGIRFQMLWIWWQSAKSVFLLTSTINQAKFNKSMLHRPPSHLLKRPCCRSQRKVQAAWASKTGWSCVRCWDLCHGPPSLSIIEHNASERHICPKPWKVEVFQWEAMGLLWAIKISPCFFCIETFPCSMPALQNLTHQPKAPFTSQGSQDLVKLLPHWGSFTFRP